MAPQLCIDCDQDFPRGARHSAICPPCLARRHDLRDRKVVVCCDCKREAPRTSPSQLRCRPCREIIEPIRGRAQRKAWYTANREAALAYHRQRNYGITDEQFAQLLVDQGGNCPICLEPLRPPGAGMGDRHLRIAVDHCHATGRIRGLLHGLCNTAIGQLRDNPENCDRAAAYLRAGTSLRN